MPRSIAPSCTPSILEEEVIFTRSALQVDPNANELLSMTDAWTGYVNDASRLRSEVLVTQAEVLAQARLAQANLATEIRSFAGTLLGAARGDRSSPLFTTYFPIPPSRLLASARQEQASQVQGWLRQYCHEPLEAHREQLTYWVTQLQGALDAEEKVRASRFSRDEDYDTLCRSLTVERGQLYSALDERAKAKGLDHRWASQFFLRG